MNTAQTTQLLDANNNNISPATCVDSLYFEKLHNGVTYRMALKNRIIVANDTMETAGKIVDNPSSLEEIKVPYFYVKQTGDGNNKLYTLCTETLNIGESVHNAILNSSELIRSVDDNKYLQMNSTDENNYMKVPLKIGSNGIVISKNKISFDDKLTIDTTNNKHKIIGSTSVEDYVIDLKNIYVGCDTTETINVSTNTTNFVSKTNLNVNSGTLNIKSTNEININSTNDTSISGNNVNIYSLNGDLNIYSSGDNKTVNIDGSIISLYNIKLSNPTELQESGSYILSTTNDAERQMSWIKLPKLSISNYGSESHNYMDSTSDVNIYLKKLHFGNIDTSVMMQNDDDSSCIYIRQITNKQRNKTVSLNGNDNDSFIYFSTINNKAIFANNVNDITNFDFSNSIESSTFYTVADTALYDMEDVNIKADYIPQIKVCKIKNNEQSGDSSPVEGQDTQTPSGQEESVFTYGINADDLEQFYPELIKNTGDYKTVNYNAVFSLMIAYLQEENKKLKERIEKLEETIEATELTEPTEQQTV